MTPDREQWRQALVQRHGETLYQRFSTAVVAICGLGGLGSHIAVALARAGIGKLILIDFDRVDTANLHRQQYKASQVGRYKTEALAENLLEIAPFLEIQTVNQRITTDNFAVWLKEAHIICEAFDAAEEKAGLINAVLETMPETYLVAASGMAGMGSPNAICTKRAMRRLYLCGDGISEAAGSMMLCPRVMLCAAHQAQTVLRILAGEYEV